MLPRRVRRRTYIYKMKKKGRAEEEREKDEEGEERERKKMPSSSRNNISNIKERFIQSKNIKEKTKNKKFRVCSRGEEAEQWINNVYRLYIGLVVFFFSFCLQSLASRKQGYTSSRSAAGRGGNVRVFITFVFLLVSCSY